MVQDLTPAVRDWLAAEAGCVSFGSPEPELDWLVQLVTRDGVRELIPRAVYRRNLNQFTIGAWWPLAAWPGIFERARELGWSAGWCNAAAGVDRVVRAG